MAEKGYSNNYAVYVALGRVLAMLCGFVVPVYLTRFLTKHDYGLYSQFFTLENFLGSILGLGISTCIYYYYPKLVGNRKSFLLNNVTLIMIAAFLGIVIINIPFVGTHIFKNEELFSFVHIISIYLFFFMPNRMLEPLFVVRKNKLISIILPPIEAISKLICVIIPSLIWGTLESIFYSIAFFQVLLFIFTILYLFRYESKSEKARLSVDLMRNQLNYSLPFGFAVILNTICGYLDRIICIGALTIEEYAIYGMAFFTIPGIKQVYDSISLVNLTNMSDAHHSNNRHMIVPLYKDFVTQTMSFSIPIVLGVCLFADDIIRLLYTERYLDATPFFRIHVLAVLFTFLGAGTILRATGNTKFTFKANLYAAVIYVPLTFILINSYGIWGAILASVLGNLLPRFFKVYYEIKLMQVRFVDYFPLRKIAMMLMISIICLIPILIVKILLKPNICVCVILGASYVAIVYFLEMRYRLFMIGFNDVKNFYVKIRNRIIKK